MVGDREHDVIGARAFGMDCVGVLYGCGSRTELERAHAHCIVTDIPALQTYLLGEDAERNTAR